MLRVSDESWGQGSTTLLLASSCLDAMKTKGIRPLASSLIVLGALLAPGGSALADEPAAEASAPAAEASAPAAPAAEADPPPDPVAEQARAHHRRGLELYDEGDYRLAVVELERAYAVSGSYKVLFNIGQVYFQLASYAKARRAFEQYLREGGAEINDARRAEVEKDLATLRARTARMNVRANVQGADVSIDDTFAGKAPLEGVLVDAGTRRIRVSSPGHAAGTRDVTLAGGDVQTITIELTESKPDVVVTTTGLPGKTIAAWIATGVLAAGAAGTGIAASAAASTYDTKRGTPIAGSPEQARDDLERQRSLVRGLAIATDVLMVSTLVVGGIALYLTLREPPKKDLPRAHAYVGGRAAGFALGF